MMSVLEYAQDVSLSVKVVLELCKKLGIDVKNEDDMLDDDSIIMLDNEIENGDLDIIDDENDEMESEEDLENEKSSVSKKNKKIIKGNNTKNSSNKNNIKNDFKKKRKEMYKHKDKLKTNSVIISEDDFVYKEGMTVSNFASELGVGVGDIIGKLMSLGMMMTINNVIDYDTAELLAVEYNKNIKREEVTNDVNFEELEIVDDESELVERPPVVTIMGHVDHGKTTLLDTIRKTNVVEGEAGGITQAIGAYQIKYNDKKITFIDTPGHADFSAEVERAINVLDGAVLVISGVEGLEAQTYTIWRALQEKNVPVIIFINKMDRKGADYEKVIAELQNNLKIPTLTLTHVQQESDGTISIVPANITEFI